MITPATMINDEPTTFYFDGKPYEPSNFEHKFYGNVSLRDAHRAFAERRDGESWPSRPATTRSWTWRGARG